MNGLDQLVMHEHARGIGDDQSRIINDKHQIIHEQSQAKQPDSYEKHKTSKDINYKSLGTASRRLKSDKKSKRDDLNTYRIDNIFDHNNPENAEEDSNESETTLTHMRMIDMFSKNTSIPIERDVPTYVPVPTPVQPPMINEDNLKSPTLAPARLPTRQQNKAIPPTRTGVSEPIGTYGGSSTVVDEDPCDGNDDRETHNSQLQNAYEHNIAIDMGNDSNNNPTIVTDDKEKDVSPEQETVDHEVDADQGTVDNEVYSDQGTVDNENIIEDIVSNENNEDTDLSIFDSKEDGSSESWKYVLLGVGSLLLAVFAAFVHFRSSKPDLYGYAGGKDGSVIVEPIDDTIPLDQSGGYSGSGANAGYSRMNSKESYSQFEDTASPLTESSLDFGSFEGHDPSTQSTPFGPPLSPLYSDQSYESSEEGRLGNIDNYTDDEDYDDDIDNENDVDEEDDDDIYLYDYEVEDPDTDEIDGLDMEESTLSWEEEEYLSTIEEESGEW